MLTQEEFQSVGKEILDAIFKKTDCKMEILTILSAICGTMIRGSTDPNAAFVALFQGVNAVVKGEVDGP